MATQSTQAPIHGGERAPAGQDVPAIRARGIVKRFGHLEAVRDGSIDLFPGEVVALVGAVLYAGALLAVPETRSVLERQPDLAAYSILAAPSFGILVGAFGGFYRRFLRLTAPNQGRRSPRSANRRPGGRTR